MRGSKSQQNQGAWVVTRRSYPMSGGEGVEELEGLALLQLLPMLPTVTNIPRPVSRIPVFPRVPVNPTWP